MTPNLSPPSDIVFIAVRFVSGISIEPHLVKRPMKFQPPSLFGGRDARCQNRPKRVFAFSDRPEIKSEITVWMHFYGVFLLCFCLGSGSLPYAYQKGPYSPLM